MDAQEYHDCPGCGLRLVADPAAIPAPWDASAECWGLYGALSAYTITRGRDEFIHQHVVDAYGAQHVGPRSRPIGVAFALLGLYYACERDYSGLQVQRMHMLLARRAKAWPPFARPPDVASMTVADVLAAEPGAARDTAIHAWARAVWAAWRAEHDRVRALDAAVMGG
ncbi:MAG TPA: DUF5946 family protein [Ktedonobacterales bacterium]|nr:DUF5946 family protein [Ktedonobacterales bacterium]